MVMHLTNGRAAGQVFVHGTKYVGTGHSAANKAQIRQNMRGRGDLGEHAGLYMAHEMDVPMSLISFQ
jgi:hypothetical protein